MMELQYGVHSTGRSLTGQYDLTEVTTIPVLMNTVMTMSETRAMYKSATSDAVTMNTMLTASSKRLTNSCQFNVTSLHRIYSQQMKYLRTNYSDYYQHEIMLTAL